MKQKPILAVLFAFSLTLMPPEVLAVDLPGEPSGEVEPLAASGQPLQMETLILNAQTNYQHGRYKEAVQLFEEAQKLGATSSYQKALISLGLAEAYRSSGRFKEAETLFKSAIAEAEEEDKKHLNKKYKAGKKRASDLVPMMMSDLSVVYLDQSRFPECEQILNSSLEIGTKKVGPNNTALALPLNGLTRLYLKWGKLSEAKSINDRAMSLFNTPQSKNNWLYLYSAYNMAQIL
ncbi:MAG: tetratricopeptide repeat protein, partial [Cyanobacteria bacterium REEB67]|nr:tetratricopeptide repeat protein [Cyanobacteria bacterium REEB67]